MHLLRLIPLAAALSGLASATPLLSTLLQPRQGATTPEGQGQLHLLDDTGNHVACLRRDGRMVTNLNSGGCYNYFEAAAYSDLQGAAFDVGDSGVCTFFRFADISYNYTCEIRSVAVGQDYTDSTFAEFQDTTLVNHGTGQLYVYAFALADGQSISRIQGGRSVQLKMAFVHPPPDDSETSE